MDSVGRERNYSEQVWYSATVAKIRKDLSRKRKEGMEVVVISVPRFVNGGGESEGREGQVELEVPVMYSW